MSKYLNTYCILAKILNLIPFSDKLVKVYYKNLTDKTDTYYNLKE